MCELLLINVVFASYNFLNLIPTSGILLLLLLQTLLLDIIKDIWCAVSVHYCTVVWSSRWAVEAVQCCGGWLHLGALLAVPRQQHVHWKHEFRIGTDVYLSSWSARRQLWWMYASASYRFHGFITSREQKHYIFQLLLYTIFFCRLRLTVVTVWCITVS